MPTKAKKNLAPPQTRLVRWWEKRCSNLSLPNPKPKRIVLACGIRPCGYVAGEKSGRERGRLEQQLLCRPDNSRCLLSPASNHAELELSRLVSRGPTTDTRGAKQKLCPLDRTQDQYCGEKPPLTVPSSCLVSSARRFTRPIAISAAMRP